MHSDLINGLDLTGLPETIEEVLEGTGHATCMAFNPYGTLLATGCLNGEVVIWDYETRGPARCFTATGHTQQVTSLLWSPSGRRLTSASLDGTATVWDVITGEVLVKRDLQRGGITHMSRRKDVSASTTENENNSAIVFSFERGPAVVLSLEESPTIVEVPMLSLEGEGKAIRVVVVSSKETSVSPGTDGNTTKKTANDSSAHGTLEAGQSMLAEVSPCGEVILTATPGLLCLLRYPSMQILDVVRVPGSPVPQNIDFAPHPLNQSQRKHQVLLAAADKQVRLYEIADHVFSSSTNLLPHQAAPAPAQEASLQEISVETLEALPPNKIPKEGSLIYQNSTTASTKSIMSSATQTASTAVLRLARKFEAHMERCNWRCARFSSDAEHVATAVESKMHEHIIYNWNVNYGFSENTLQGGGKDGIIALTWHPSLLPMQLLALGASGKIYIWAKIFTQQWRAFAPDFEDLKENREHVELETEFDINPTKEGEEDVGMIDAGSDDEESTKEILDIVTLAEDPVHTANVSRLLQGEQPLYHLPVQIPDFSAPLGQTEQEQKKEEEEKERLPIVVEEQEENEKGEEKKDDDADDADQEMKGVEEEEEEEIEVSPFASAPIQQQEQQQQEQEQQLASTADPPPEPAKVSEQTDPTL